MISRQKVKSGDYIGGSPLSAIASFSSPPKALGITQVVESMPVSRSPPLEQDSTTGEDGPAHSAGASLAHGMPRPSDTEASAFSQSDVSPVGTPSEASAEDTEGESSSVLAKYIQKFQEEDPNGVWDRRSHTSPRAGIRRHLSLPQLPSLNEEEQAPNVPIPDYDSADSSGSGYHSTKSCPVSPHDSDRQAPDEHMYLWQRRQKFSTSLPGIKVLSDFYDPAHFTPPSSQSLSSTPSMSRPLSAGSISRSGSSSMTVPVEDIVMEGAEGEDRYGVQYRGKWKSMDVSVRILKIKVGQDVEQEEAMQLLAEMMSSLRHPNLELYVGHTAADRPSAQILTLAEYLPHCVEEAAPALHRKGRREALPMAHRWALELFRGMTYLHTGSPPVALCDLHPEDLRLDADMHLKITDVGLRTALRRRGLDTPTDKISVYTAPELIAGGKAARKPTADMYSCGMIVWFLYHGKHPRRTEEGRSKPPAGQMKEKELSQMVQQCWEGPDDRPLAAECIKTMEAVKGKVAAGGSLRSLHSPRSCCVQ